MRVQSSSHLLTFGAATEGEAQGRACACGSPAGAGVPLPCASTKERPATPYQRHLPEVTPTHPASGMPGIRCGGGVGVGGTSAPESMADGGFLPDNRERGLLEVPTNIGKSPRVHRREGFA